MARLRRVSCSGPGLTRRRRGKGFEYRWPDGRTVREPAVLQRVRDLAIPPAWNDVWICQAANGHLQAVGTDAAGRRQYLYHPQWRADRDRAKHERVTEMGRLLPAARARVAADLGDPGEVTRLLRRDPSVLGRDRVMACAFRLLDLGFFRVGGEEYAEEHGSFGLSTLLREHVRVGRDGTLTFSYTGKHGVHRELTLADPQAFAVVAAVARRRRTGEQLLVFADPDPATGEVVWRDVTSAHINAYVGELLPGATAKDFRTWHATVLAAMALAVSEPTLASPTARKRAVARAMREVSSYLGNTPAVARASYVDPRVVDLFHDGRTIAGALTRIGEPGAGSDGAESASSAPGTHGAVEDAVLELLTGPAAASAPAAATG